MLSMLITLIVFLVVVWALFYLVDIIPISPNIKVIAKVVIGVIALIEALIKFGPIIGIH